MRPSALAPPKVAASKKSRQATRSGPPSFIRQVTSPISRFISISAGAVSVAMAMLMPMSRSFEKLLRLLPLRADTSGQWMIETPLSA